MMNSKEHLKRQYERLKKRLSRSNFQRLSAKKKAQLYRRLLRCKQQLYRLAGATALIGLGISSAQAQAYCLQSGSDNIFQGIRVGTAGNQFDGQSTPQIVDVDGDGDFDLIIGDYEGDVIYYENIGDNVNPIYEERTGLDIDNFSPFNAVNVYSHARPHLTDVDGDGDLDLMVGEYYGKIAYYRNVGSSTNPIYFELTGINNPFNSIDVGDHATPEFVDVNGDGDKDVIAGNLAGEVLYFENDGNNNFTQQMGANDPFSAISLESRTAPHLVDVDGDSDLDLLVGDYSGEIFYYENVGSSTNPTYTPRTGTSNPFADVNVGSFSVPQLIDLDSDSDLDLVVGALDGLVRYFKNVPTCVNASSVDGFVDCSQDILDNIRLVEYADQQLVDVDGDGDLDLAVTDSDGDVLYYQNNGNDEFVFQSGTNNPFDEIEASAEITLQVVDVDGDGDLDVILGRYNGDIRYYQNDGNDNFDRQIGTNNPFEDIEFIGNNPNNESFRPEIHLVDVDGDGDLDLIVGEYYGAVGYFQNDGSNNFTEQTGTDNPFDGIEADVFASPFLADVDNDGVSDFVLGNDDGKIFYYRNAGSNMNPSFVQQTGTDNPFDDIDVGSLAKPQLIDADNDGDVDLLVGAADGKVRYYPNADLSIEASVDNCIDAQVELSINSTDTEGKYTINTPSNVFSGTVGTAGVLGTTETIMTSISEVGIYAFEIVLDPFQCPIVATTVDILDECALPNNILTVSENADLGGDGTSWFSAFRYLQDAIAAANANNSITEIWVAEGVYYPDEDEAGNVTNNDESATFQLPDNVSILGGFDGSESESTQRDAASNITILSGDIQQDDTNTDGNNIAEQTSDIQGGNNSDHVVTGSGTNNTAVLDGFTITAGQDEAADPQGVGAGMLNVSGSPTLQNLRFIGNEANTLGGGMFNNTSSRPILTNVSFIANSSNNDGGGMANRQISNPTLINVSFIGNTASDNGGAINNIGSRPQLINVVFSKNTAVNSGGAIYNSSSDAELINVSFSKNTATLNGGGIFNFSSNPIISNSVFYENTVNGSVNSIANSSFFGGAPNVSYSYFDDVSLSSGTVDGGNNLLGQANPFVNAANDDLRLLVFSTAIDAGNNVPNTVATDLAGNPRKFDDEAVSDTGNGTAPIIDMGAFERQSNSTTILYVNSDAATGGDGTAWNEAYKYLQDAIAAATINSSITEIWVAEGVYYPDEDEAGNVTDNDEDATFQLLDNINILGGFDGTESSSDQRNIAANVTILSGDIEQDDTDANNDHIANQTSDIIGSNSIHVVTTSNNDATAVLDGFIITAGQANGTGFNRSNGGGLFNSAGTPSLRNLSFIGNIADNDGGAMFDAFGAPTLINVSFYKNHAQRGGAIFSDDTRATLVNVSFSLNTASNEGGAMYNLNFGEALSISNSIFYGNTANGSVNSIATSNFGSAPFMTISYSYFDDASLSSDIVDGGNNLLSQADPFVDAANDDLQLVAFSTAIDAGDNSQNSSSEDAASNARNYDDTGVTDTGAGSAPIIDMGAFERQTDSEDNCPSDPIMLSVPETGTTDYITQAEITSTQSIESGAVVLYQAGTNITLSAGFHAKSGSTFTARIKDCAAQNSTEEEVEERSEETDTDKAAQALQVAIFPNPFSSTTNIQFYLATAGNVVLTITDMNGKVVHQQQYLDLQSGEYQHQFDANNLPAGMYFLHIRSAEQQVVKQLVLQQ